MPEHEARPRVSVTDLQTWPPARKNTGTPGTGTPRFTISLMTRWTLRPTARGPIAPKRTSNGSIFCEATVTVAAPLCTALTATTARCDSSFDISEESVVSIVHGHRLQFGCDFSNGSSPVFNSPTFSLRRLVNTATIPHLTTPSRGMPRIPTHR